MAERKGPPCARCGHGQKAHLYGKDDCMVGVVGGPCDCLSFKPTTEVSR